METKDQRSIGLLIVHGIGEQSEGQTAAKLVAGLKHVYGDDQVDERGQDPITITLKGSVRTLLLYEVYWANVLSGKAEGSFNMETLLSIPWLPHFSLRDGFFGETPPSRFTRFVGGGILHLLSACLYFGYYGSHALTNLWLLFSGLFLMTYGLVKGLCLTAYRVVAIGYHLLVIGLVIAFDVCRRPFRRADSHDTQPDDHRLPTPTTDVYANPANDVVPARRARTSTSGKHDWLGRHPVDVRLDAYLGDVFTYVRSLGLLENPLQGFAILERFHTALRRACEACDEVHILSHSLGTVIMYHGLTGYCLPPITGEALESNDRPFAKLTRIYTIGSPLDKLWHFWPRLVKRNVDTGLVLHDGEPRQSAWTATARTFTWDNFHNPLDVVADRLVGFGGWPPVKNHRVWGGGAVRSHVIYEWNHTFLSVVVEGVFGIPAKPRLQGLRGSWALLVSGFESAAATGFLLRSRYADLATVWSRRSSFPGWPACRFELCPANGRQRSNAECSWCFSSAWCLLLSVWVGSRLSRITKNGSGYCQIVFRMTRSDGSSAGVKNLCVATWRARNMI